MVSIPPHAWSRGLDEPEPDASVHTHFKPHFLEALSLLPVAFRIGSYIHTERTNGKEPIFDLNGIMLAPPHPGPHAGVPMGGLGGGAIGRGFKGEFRRWSLQPGKYHHHVVTADAIAIRVKRGYAVHTKVLSLAKPGPRSCLSSWTWGMDPACGKYHAVFPYSWTVYDDPVPNIRVTVKQTSPFLPEDYASSSLPAACLSVVVENKSSMEDAEVSVMLCFQNGTENDDWDVDADWHHFPFKNTASETATASQNSSIVGVCMPHRTRKAVVKVCDSSTENPLMNTLHGPAGGSTNVASFVEDRGSYAIAAEGSSSATLSHCTKFVTIKSIEPEVKSAFSLCTAEEYNQLVDSGDESLCAQALWKSFKEKGDIASFSELPPYRQGVTYGGAVCSRQVVSRAAVGNSNNIKTFDFSLSWDHPLARFGAGLGLPRFYSRFFGCSGMAAPLMATLALRQCAAWQESIDRWQRSVIEKVDMTPAPGANVNSHRKKKEERQFYLSQVFNELYFLVDGGTLWTDSCGGKTNQTELNLTMPSGEVLLQYAASIQKLDEAITQSISAQRASVGADQLLDSNVKLNSNSGRIETVPCLEILQSSLTTILDTMLGLNHDARDCGGDQRVVGQFLYLEGHEYLMYNTYDVHFYASFALLMLWPQLELSLQRDFAAAVPMEDTFVRRMMGEGSCCERKAKNFLPHDLGSPSEEPWRCLNAYNFQDVSRWKDLGPKFLLQVYRDYVFTRDRLGPEGATRFLSELYISARTIMAGMETFDKDKDGMIENSGFPDQTYDIWIATGVHAYCGGLWIAACEAMAAMARLQDDILCAQRYSDIAAKARVVYVDKLWNGKYLCYDNSFSYHHDSIMADMLAGQWFSHVCQLPPTIDARKALSCFRTIYQNNVVEFGQGKLLGAVNGMRPGGNGSKAHVDDTCIQSREVWTGTTYALASAMVLEASHHGEAGPDALTEDERAELWSMAFSTAKGIHDAGWKEFGYWFATPEAWCQNGNYRSMGYMRALCIWSIQFAITH